MKVLSVPQPYASLIAAGIYNSHYETWRPKDESSRVLIYANKKRISKRSFIANESIDFIQRTLNHITFGNIPDFKDMPNGAIIGYVTIDTTKKPSDNNGIYYDWHFKDAYLFDEPVAVEKGKPRLWDYDLNEDSLPPAHKVIINEARFKDSNIYIPLNKSLWDNLKPDNSITLEFTEALQDQYEKELGPLSAFDVTYQLHFTFNGLKRSFFVKMNSDNEFDMNVPEWCIYSEINDDGTPCIYYSERYDEMERQFITFYFDEEVE